MLKIETMEQYEQESKKGEVILLFSADWCPDCRVIEPVLPRITADYPEFTFLYLDRDKFIDLCTEMNVFGIPSFIALKDGEEIHRFVSKDRKTEAEIAAFLDEASARI
ncbi:MAG TPA: thioredoxin family protein [Bacilli bacterium]|nr:thioredoxin family protein [Bacilli bacterium]